MIKNIKILLKKQKKRRHIPVNNIVIFRQCCLPVKNFYSKNECDPSSWDLLPRNFQTAVESLCFSVFADIRSA